MLTADIFSHPRRINHGRRNGHSLFQTCSEKDIPLSTDDSIDNVAGGALQADTLVNRDDMVSGEKGAMNHAREGPPPGDGWPPKSGPPPVKVLLEEDFIRGNIEDTTAGGG